MKSLFAFWIGLLFVTAWLSGCDRQEVVSAPVVEPPLVQLNYDGPNVTAPLLPTGFYEAAIRLRSAQLAGLEGRQLVEVILFMQEIPTSATVRILEGTSNSTPLNLISSQGVRSELIQDGWSRIQLTSPVTINEQDDLWVTLRFEHTSEAQTLGCDAGPADENGDFLFDGSDNQWQKLSLRSGGGININWNMRAVIE